MDQFRHPIADRNGGYHCAACGVLVEDGSWDEQGEPSLPADELCTSCAEAAE